MLITKICVLGGSGFIGTSIVTMLAARRCVVRVPTRNRERIKRLLVLPTADFVAADVHDPAELERLTAGMDAVINLVGILHERKRGDFAKVHAELPAKVIAACKKNGVQRLLHMSALNAGVAGPSEYLRSKGRGEQAVTSGAAGIDVTVFRPSVVFGRKDNFLNMLAKLTRRLPIIVLGSPNARFQPVYVEDVARVFVDALDDARTHGRCYDVCGPRIYTLRELVQLVGRMTGAKRRIFGLGDGLSYLQAWLLEPTRIITRDNFYSMKMDSVCASPFPFSFEPAAIESVVPAYLTSKAANAR
jgi:NADH dehydrogenase